MKEITNELEKTKKSFSLFSRLRKKSNLDSQVWDDFEEIMIQADVGVVTTQKIIERLQKHVREKQLDTPEDCLLYTSPSPRDKRQSRMPSSA